MVNLPLAYFKLFIGYQSQRELETVSIAEPLQNRQHAQNP